MNRSAIDQLGDIPNEEFRERLHKLADWVADYREHIAERPIAPNDKPGAVLAQLDQAPPEAGAALDEIFSDIERVIVPGVTHWAHTQFMSYSGCTTTSPGILAEMITAAMNVNAMTWRTLPHEFQGIGYDTASISTMHALATAREQAAPNTRKLGLSGHAELPAFRIYTSDQAHSSVAKGAIAIGIGEDNVRRIPSDSNFRMDLPKLRDAITADVKTGLRPLAVVATVGTTSTASVD